MATQRIYYRLSDNLVQYIDYYTSSDGTQPTGPNTATQQDILGFYEADSYSSFIAVLDYSLPGNCSGLSGPGENWVDDFWACKHKYYAIPSAYSIYMGDAIVQQNNFHYGVWYYNRSTESPSVSASDQGFILRVSRYPDDQTASTVSGFFGSTVAPYTKGIFLIPGSGQSFTWGRSKFLNKQTAASFDITNNGWYDLWNSGTVELTLNTNDGVSLASGYSSSGGTVTRYSPSIRWLGSVTPTLYPGGSASVEIYNINVTAPSATELFVCGYDQASQLLAMQGDGSYLDSNHCWITRLTRTSVSSAWSGPNIVSGASDGSSVTVSATYGVAGNWVVKAIEASYNIQSQLLSVTVNPLSTNNYVIYTLQTSGYAQPASSNWGFIDKIIQSQNTNLTVDPLYYGENGTIACPATASPAWYSTRGVAWAVPGSSSFGINLNASGYNAWAGRVAAGKRYRKTGTASANDGIVEDCGTLPANRNTISIDMPEGYTDYTGNAWYTVNVSGISSGADDIQFKASLIKYSGGSTRSATGFMVSKSGGNWPNGNASSAQFFIKMPPSQNETNESPDYFRLEAVEGFGNDAVTSTYAGTTTQRQISAYVWRGGYYCWYTNDGTTAAPNQNPASAQAYCPRRTWGADFGYSGTFGAQLANIFIYPIIQDDVQWASFVATSADHFGPSGSVTIFNFGGTFDETGGMSMFLPATSGGLAGDIAYNSVESKFGVPTSSGHTAMVSGAQINAPCPNFNLVNQDGGFLASSNYNVSAYSGSGSCPSAYNGSVEFASGDVAFSFIPTLNSSTTSGNYYAISGNLPANSKATRLNFQMIDIEQWWNLAYSTTSASLRPYMRGWTITRPSTSSVWPKPSGTYWDSASIDTFGLIIDIGGLTGGGSSKTYGIHSLDNYGSSATYGTDCTKIGLYPASAGQTVGWNHRIILTGV